MTMQQKRNYWIDRARTCRTAALAAVLALAPGMLLAQPPGASVPDTVAARVNLADLDLTTLEGSRAARERIAAMARRLCGTFRDERRVSAWETYVECTRETSAAALARLDATATLTRSARQGSAQPGP